MFTPGETVALAERIIDDTCFVFIYFLAQFFKDHPLSSVGNEKRSNVGHKTNKKKDSLGKSAELSERLKVVAEFQGPVEHASFISSITKEKEIKSRIKELMR